MPPWLQYGHLTGRSASSWVASGKAATWPAFANGIKGSVVHVGLFGGAREELEPELSKSFTVTWDETLEQAVKRQAACAETGDVILLSPATASFDQYNGMAQRGADFKRVVGGLDD